MSKQPQKITTLADPPKIRSRSQSYQCDDCGYYYDEGDIYLVGKKYLCVRCLDDRDAIVEEERHLHYRG